MSTTKINRAIHNCLEKCFHSRKPLDVLACFMAELQARGWSGYEIFAIEMRVMRLLKGIVSRPS